MTLSYSDTINILECFKSVEDVKKVQELLEEYEDNFIMRKNYVYEYAETEGVIDID